MSYLDASLLEASNISNESEDSNSSNNSENSNTSDNDSSFDARDYVYPEIHVLVKELKRLKQVVAEQRRLNSSGGHEHTEKQGEVLAVIKVDEEELEKDLDLPQTLRSHVISVFRSEAKIQ